MLQELPYVQGRTKDIEDETLVLQALTRTTAAQQWLLGTPRKVKGSQFQ